MKKLLLTLLLISTISLAFSTRVTAQEGQETLQNIEEERTNKLESQLGLTIPEITDNPNHVISFTDPSSEKAGVQLEIDGQGFREITSPYTLPSLGIGRHVLTFRFTDREETRQTLEKILVVVPRPPVVNAPTGVSTEQITVKGTALIGSIVDIFLSGGTTHLKAEATVQADGTWSHTFENTFPLQIYNVVAITKRSGFASSFSETIVFELSEGDVVNTPSSNVKPIHFAFKDINRDNFKDVFKNNLDLVYLSILLFLLGTILATLLSSNRKATQLKRVEGHFHQMFKSNEQSNKGETEDKGTESSKKLTLREKFEQAGIANKEAQKTVEEKNDNRTDLELEGKEISESSEIMTKDEFMEKFKEQDPDDEKGKEKKAKKKKNVKVSLTS